MSKKRDDDGEMSDRGGNGGAQGPSDGMPRKKERAGDLGHDGGALGPDQGTARGDHAESNGGKSAHSSHMPNC